MITDMLHRLSVYPILLGNCCAALGLFSKLGEGCCDQLLLSGLGGFTYEIR